MSFPNAPFQSIISDASSKLTAVWSQWFTRVQDLLNSLTLAGTTSQRPTQQLWTGQRYWDSTLNQLVVWTGSQWVSAAVGYYASFYDTTHQTAASTTAAYAITCDTGNGHDGIEMRNDSEITFLHPGTYNVQFSLQLTNADNNDTYQEVDVWFRLNGQNVDYSNSVFTVPTRHGSIYGHLIAALNFVVTTQSDNEYIQIMWHTNNTNISIETLPVQSSPTRPVTPSVIITAQQI